MSKFGLLIAGVGGQGVVVASDIAGQTALAAGYDVKKTDTLGMAQRGGSVISHLRIAPKVYSPLIGEGSADFLLAFEKLEAARWIHYLKQGGIAIVNNQAMYPLSVSLGSACYPGDAEIMGIINQRTDRVYLVGGTSCARELGNVKALNVFMLGCLSLFLPLEPEKWQEAIWRRLPARVAELNITAFDRGRREIQNVLVPETE